MFYHTPTSVVADLKTVPKHYDGLRVLHVPSQLLSKFRSFLDLFFYNALSTASKQMKRKEFYRRNLPHLQPIGGTFFVTYILENAVPKPLYEKWKQQFDTELLELERAVELGVLSVSYHEAKDAIRKRFFLLQDKYIDSRAKGDFYLRDHRLAQVVAESLHFWDTKKIELICYCIMPNHVHAVLRMLKPDEALGNEIHLADILQSIKRFSSLECNRLLGKKGKFWKEESYDRLVRDRDEMGRIISYVLDNPVKAGLCTGSLEWKWSYIKPEYNEYM